jgi:acetoacetyl-CoA reductase
MTARVALVTGGTGGIGTAICKRLAGMGLRVATNYRNEAKALEWQAARKAEGFDIAVVPGDVGTVRKVVPP